MIFKFSESSHLKIGGKQLKKKRDIDLWPPYHTCMYTQMYLCTLTQTCTCTIHTMPHTHKHTHTRAHTHTLKTNFTMYFLSLGPGSDILGLMILHVWGYTCNICVCTHIWTDAVCLKTKIWHSRRSSSALRAPSETWEQEPHLSLCFLFTNSPIGWSWSHGLVSHKE